MWSSKITYVVEKSFWRENPFEEYKGAICYSIALNLQGFIAVQEAEIIEEV